MPWEGLIPNATPNTIPKAFIVNAIASAFVVAFTIYLQSKLPDRATQDEGLQLVEVMGVAIMSSLLTYLLLYLLVGYGSSMVGNTGTAS